MNHATGEPRESSGASPGHGPRQSVNALVARISLDFLHVRSRSVEEAIRRALNSVGTFVNADRTFVLRLEDAERFSYDLQHEWAPASAENQRDQDDPRTPLHLPSIHARLAEGEAIEFATLVDSKFETEDERAHFQAWEIQSAVLIPMIAESGVVGVFGVASATPNHVWPDATVALSRIVADIIVTANERQEEHEALRRRTDAEEVIRSIATLVIGLTADELDDGYTRALEMVGEFIKADRCYIRMTGIAHAEEPKLAGWRGPQSAEFDPKMLEFDLFKTFPAVAHMLVGKENVVVSSLENLPSSAVDEAAVLRQFQIEAFIMSPIHANESLAGILNVEMNNGPRQWTDIDIMFVTIAAQILGGMRLRQIVDDERRRLQRQMQHTQKLESMGVLAGGIAHDFNNLLVGILGNTELMLMDSQVDESTRKKLEQIDSSARRAADLVNQLLTYTGKGFFRTEPVDVSELISGLVTLVKTVIPKKTEVQTELEDGLPLIEGDPLQVRQIVMNLVTNAAEAIGDHSGRILLCTGFGTFDSEFFNHTVGGTNLEPGDYVIIEVTDTGCGMDDETKSRIFDPFFTTKFAGRGLGLAATLGIVRAHRGALNVLSWPQKGTTVQILLPATTLQQERTAPAPIEEQSDSGGGTVLVIDDELSVRRVTRSVLEHFGYDVLVAENGLRGIRLLEQNPEKVDLVILDMSMPKMNGEETLRRIRDAYGQLPVVLTSGYTELEISDRVGGLDASAFVGKPFSPKELIQQVRKLL